MALLTVSGISKIDKGNFTANDISFTQEAFQKIAVAGGSGSGKTTLLKMIAGFIQPDAGEIFFEHKKMKGPNDQLIPGHAGMAYLSQHFELRNNYWVHEILSYANELSQQDADNLYAICRIDHLLGRRTDQLSGGEKQRIALTRLLIGSPRLFLLDEPFSNLDAVHAQIMQSVMDDLHSKLGITCIMVSHDAPDMLAWADTVLVIKDGRLEQQGSPETIYRQPISEYCAGIFGEYNLIDAQDAILLNPSITPQTNHKKMLVRPEQLILAKESNGLKAVVKKILFHGSYYAVDVKTERQSLKIRTTDQQFVSGEEIMLTVLPQQGWYI